MIAILQKVNSWVLDYRDGIRDGNESIPSSEGWLGNGEIIVKTRMIKVAGLALAGTLLFSVAYKEQTEIEVVQAASSASLTNALLGTTEKIAEEAAEVNTDAAVVAGVSELVSDYLTTENNVAVKAQAAVTTGNGQDNFGYQNLGIADVDGNLNVREQASTDAELVGKMPDNAGCEILETEGEWTKIKSGEVEGYVKSEFLLSGEAAQIRAEEVKQTVATVTTTTLYVREQPNTECTIITMMPEGEELEVIEELDGWVKINVDSDEGYVSADYVDISVELKKAMTMTEVRYGQGVSDVRVSLVQYATQFVGNPYVWGGTSLTRGADCSGFVLSVFANYGVYLPHSAAAQSGYGTRISASEARPGDLFFYSNGSRINHVAIYIGNGQVVHASSPKTGIKISGAYYRTPVKVVRLLGE